MFYLFVRSIVWVLLHIIYACVGGIRFEGRNNVPRKGGVLITPNHISDADPPTICLALPRTCWVMAKEELFDMKVVGTLIRWLQGFPIKRDTADRSALRRAEELLKAGEAVVIFPEGRISENAELLPILPGALLAAQRANVLVVPTILINTNLVMPYTKLIPRYAGKRTIVRFGPPVSVAELTEGAKGGDKLKQGAERLGQILLALQQNKPYPTFDNEPHLKPHSEADPIIA